MQSIKTGLGLLNNKIDPRWAAKYKCMAYGCEVDAKHALFFLNIKS